MAKGKGFPNPLVLSGLRFRGFDNRGGSLTGGGAEFFHLLAHVFQLLFKAGDLGGAGLDSTGGNHLGGGDGEAVKAFHAGSRVFLENRGFDAIDDFRGLAHSGAEVGCDFENHRESFLSRKEPLFVGIGCLRAVEFSLKIVEESLVRFAERHGVLLLLGLFHNHGGGGDRTGSGGIVTDGIEQGDGWQEHVFHNVVILI